MSVSLPVTLLSVPWIRRAAEQGLGQQCLILDYSLVGYNLAPNSTIMSHAIENKKFAHK